MRVSFLFLFRHLLFVFFAGFCAVCFLVGKIDAFPRSIAAVPTAYGLALLPFMGSLVIQVAGKLGFIRCNAWSRFGSPKRIR
jgi:hypothetical protein